jgi:DNA polymerase elongation subunit (family B)
MGEATSTEYTTNPDGTFNIPKEDIVGYEPGVATYVMSQANQYDDMIALKEKVHLKSGKILNQLRMIRNYKRDFWVTREGFRKHEQSKESEELSKVKKFTCTQRKLAESIARAINWSPVKPRLKTLCRSPFVYGADISSTSLVKEKYMTAFPDCKSTPDVAVYDLETNVYTKEQEIISGSLTMKDKAVLAVTKDFISGLVNPVDAVHKAFEGYVREKLNGREVNLEVVVVENEAEVVTHLIGKAHEWKPDFLAIWNMNFDIPKSLLALKRHHMDPAVVFSDPMVPPEFKYCRYREAERIKKTASGKTTQKHVADLWHTLTCPASFYVIDFMCLYKLIRVTEGNQPKYSLDAILKVNGLDGKLDFEEADSYSGLEWHKFMQLNYKVEYLIYNLFDCIKVEELDEKNSDSSTFITLCQHSDWEKFTSTPKRLCDDLHFFYLEEGRVIGTTSDQMESELDNQIFDMTDWIRTLSTHLTSKVGAKIIKEMPDFVTNITCHVSDLDVSASYPNTESALNTSKATTLREMCQIRGKHEVEAREIVLNMTAPVTNAVWLCKTIYNYPSMDEMLREFNGAKTTTNQEIIIEEVV